MGFLAGSPLPSAPPEVAVARIKDDGQSLPSMAPVSSQEFPTIDHELSRWTGMSRGQIAPRSFHPWGGLKARVECPRAPGTQGQFVVVMGAFYHARA
jgi:hypothetical protein